MSEERYFGASCASCGANMAHNPCCGRAEVLAARLDEARARADALAAENERLRWQRDEAQGSAESHAARADAAEKERDEARLALSLSSWSTFSDRLTALCMSLAPKAKNIADVIEAAVARRDRLLAALREIQSTVVNAPLTLARVNALAAAAINNNEEGEPK